MRFPEREASTMEPPALFCAAACCASSSARRRRSRSITDSSLSFEPAEPRALAVLKFSFLANADILPRSTVLPGGAASGWSCFGCFRAW